MLKNKRFRDRNFIHGIQRSSVNVNELPMEKFYEYDREREATSMIEEIKS